MSTLSQFFGGLTTNGVPVELLVVAGGGGTTSVSSTRKSGGGGAGELVYCKDLLLPVGVSYTITVGGGGSIGSGNGSNSAFGSLLAGGGGGGGGVTSSVLPLVGTQGLPGRRGSGGGASADSNYAASGAPGPGSVFAGNPLGTAKYQVFGANSGGDGCAISAGPFGGGGGGSGAAAPAIKSAISAAPGGAGSSIDITGAVVTYAAGGAAGQNFVSGTANTGNGAGGATGDGSGAAGGSGVVIIAYPDIYAVPTTITGTYNEPTRSGWRVYRFTGSGSITL